MRGLAAVYGGSAPHHRALHEPKYARWLAATIYLPDLPAADLSAYAGLLVPERIHAGLLDAARPHLLAFLEEGGTLVVFAEQSVYRTRPVGWLPGIAWEHRPTNYWWWREPGGSLGLHAHHPEHSLWRYLTLADATWHHHGVFRPPPEAVTLISAADGGGVLYVDEVSTPGRLVVAALDPLYHFGSYFMPPAERFLDGFLPWVVEELLWRAPAVAPEL